MCYETKSTKLRKLNSWKISMIHLYMMIVQSIVVVVSVYIFRQRKRRVMTKTNNLSPAKPEELNLMECIKEGPGNVALLKGTERGTGLLPYPITIITSLNPLEDGTGCKLPIGRSKFNNNLQRRLYAGTLTIRTSNTCKKDYRAKFVLRCEQLKVVENLDVQNFEKE